MPSRKTVYAGDYRAACDAASATSDPPRKVSKQAFHLFPKIREIDVLLRGNEDFAARIFECHPEGAFRMMKGAPLQQPKKLKSKIYKPGLDERRRLLMAQGYAVTLVDALPPRPAGRDDLLDACATAWTAARIATNKAHCWPDGAPARDAFCLPVAIWT